MEDISVKTRAARRCLIDSVLIEYSAVGGRSSDVIRTEMESLLEGCHFHGDHCDMAWREIEKTINHSRYARWREGACVFRRFWGGA